MGYMTSLTSGHRSQLPEALSRFSLTNGVPAKDSKPEINQEQTPDRKQGPFTESPTGPAVFKSVSVMKCKEKL